MKEGDTDEAATVCDEEEENASEGSRWKIQGRAISPK